MTLRTMNDVRKWLGDIMDERCKEDWDRGRQEVASEMLDIIGRDAAPDPWESMADELTVLLDRQRLNCGNQDDKRIESAISAYRKLKEESRGTSS